MYAALDTADRIGWATNAAAVQRAST